MVLATLRFIEKSNLILGADLTTRIALNDPDVVAREHIFIRAKQKQLLSPNKSVSRNRLLIAANESPFLYIQSNIQNFIRG